MALRSDLLSAAFGEGEAWKAGVALGFLGLGFLQSAGMDRFFEGVEADFELGGDVAAALALIEELLSLGDDGGSHDGGAAGAAFGGEEGMGTFFAEGFDAALEADFRNAESAADIDDPASSLADQLGGDELEGGVVVFGVQEDRHQAVGVLPAVVTGGIKNAEHAGNLACASGDHRQ